MKLLEIHKNVFVNPDEIVSIEHDVVKEYRSPSPSDCSMFESFNGSKIILKNGRKIHIDKVMPKTILETIANFKELNK